ncbi:hypothetical protein MMC19_006798 [Ptychographa xylographoides]|nr:hypothetical protein [Ptychographa xylographoides]
MSDLIIRNETQSGSAVQDEVVPIEGGNPSELDTLTCIATVPITLPKRTDRPLAREEFPKAASSPSILRTHGVGTFFAKRAGFKAEE